MRIRTVTLRAASFIVAGLLPACGPTQDVVFRIELIAGPNLIQNGSFEADREVKFVSTASEPIVVGGGPGGPPFKNLCGGSNSLTNWQVARIGAKQQDCTFVAMSWFDVLDNRLGIGVPNGRMAVNLLGFPRPGLGSLEQPIQTLPDYNYTLSFWIGSSNVFNKKQNSIQVDVVDAETDDIRLSESFTAPAVTGPSEWIRIDRTFTATGSKTIISFTASSAAGGDAVFVGLDDVQVHCYGRPGLIFLGGC